MGKSIQGGKKVMKVIVTGGILDRLLILITATCIFAEKS